MKKFLLSFFFFSLMVVGAQAQKACCSKMSTKSAASCEAKVSSVATASFTESSTDAAKMASRDQTIETRTDPIGNVSYVRKETCAHSGSVSYVNVSYDAATSSFVNVSPVKMEGGHSCTSKATSTSGKSCCAAGAASGKSCCAGKAASAKTTEKIKS